MAGYAAAILIIVIPSLGWERKSDRHVKAGREYDRIALEIHTAVRSETQDETFSSFEHRMGEKIQNLATDPEVDPPSIIKNRSMELVNEILDDEVKLATRQKKKPRSPSLTKPEFQEEPQMLKSVPLNSILKTTTFISGVHSPKAPKNNYDNNNDTVEQSHVIDIWS